MNHQDSEELLETREMVKHLLDCESLVYEGDNNRHRMAVALLGPCKTTSTSAAEMRDVSNDRSARLLAMRLWSRACENPKADDMLQFDYRTTWALVDFASANVAVAAKALEYIPRSEFDLDGERELLDIAWSFRPNPQLQRWVHAKPVHCEPAPANQLELEDELSPTSAHANRFVYNCELDDLMDRINDQHHRRQ